MTTAKPSLLIQNATASPLLSAPGSSEQFAVRCVGGLITAIEPVLNKQPGEAVIDASGGAMLPGLHDHHLHLFAAAAAHRSIDCAMLTPYSADELQQRITQAANDPGRAVRVVNYHEELTGPLDRHVLDRWVPDGIVLRVQHSTGQMWFLNSTALAKYRVAQHSHPGIERDGSGKPNGRLFRCDHLLRKDPATAEAQSPPSLAALSQQLARFGVTGITDTSPGNSPDEHALFAAQQGSGELLQHLRLMGDESLWPMQEVEPSNRAERGATLGVGELKIILDEADLPDIDELGERVAQAHALNRSVAFHCVGRIELALILSVLNSVGTLADRIEHASLVSIDVIAELQRLGVTVVTQPELIHSRGERYLAQLSADELTDLYRLRSLWDANISVAASSDAPYANLNPWRGMACAVARTTAGGAQISPAEAVTAEQALALYCGSLAQPGNARTPAVGDVADLCVLSKSWAEARTTLSDVTVAHTIRAGQPIYSAL